MLSTLSNKDPFVDEMDSIFKIPVLVSQLIVANKSKTDLTVDPTQFKIKLRNGDLVDFLSTEKVLNSAVKDKEKFKSFFLGPHKIRPFSKYMNIMLFTPRDYDWEKVVSVIIYVNGKRLEIKGRMFSEAEKRKLYEQALQRKNQ